MVHKYLPKNSFGRYAAIIQSTNVSKKIASAVKYAASSQSLSHVYDYKSRAENIYSNAMNYSARRDHLASLPTVSSVDSGTITT